MPPLPTASDPNPTDPPKLPRHHLPQETWTDSAGASHTLAFTRPDSLVALKTIMPSLGYLLQQSEQNEGASIFRLVGGLALDAEPDPEALLDQLMQRLAEEVIQSGNEELTVLLLAHVTLDDRTRLTAEVIKLQKIEDITSLVLLVLRREYAPFFSRRIARINANEKPIMEAARTWLRKNGLDAIAHLVTRRFSSTLSGSPKDESPTES